MRPWGIEFSRTDGDIGKEELVVGIAVTPVPMRKSWGVVVNRPGVSYVVAYCHNEEGAQRLIEALGQVLDNVMWQAQRQILTQVQQQPSGGNGAESEPQSQPQPVDIP
jgi:hypothetical protein